MFVSTVFFFLNEAGKWKSPFFAEPFLIQLCSRQGFAACLMSVMKIKCPAGVKVRGWQNLIYFY